MHTLAVTEQGTHVHVEGDRLILHREEKAVHQVRLGELHQVLLLGRVEISSAAIAALARRGIDLVFLSRHGRFRGRLIAAPSGNVQLRLNQFERRRDDSFCVRLAQALVAAKITHQRQILLRAQRRLKDAELADILGRLRILVDKCRRQKALDPLRGVEGTAAALYFGQFGKLLRVTNFSFTGRNRRPPRDPVNACLSFGYAVLASTIETELLRCGLDPMVGFFHQPAHGRSSLTLDLLEEYRPFVDGLVLRLINRRQLSPLDFDRHGPEDLVEILAQSPADDVEDPDPATAPGPPDANAEAVFLSQVGRKVFLAEFYRRLRQRLYYPPRQGSFELRSIIREQAYHLARVIDGHEAVYRPFVPG